MPAEESGGGEVFGFRYWRLVEFLVVRVYEGYVLKTFVLVVVAVADDLDLGLVRDCLELRGG